MDTATAVLRKEHEAILKMLAVTEEVARRLEGRERIAPETLANLIQFFRLFADKCYHGKEEDLLFPNWRRKGCLARAAPSG